MIDFSRYKIIVCAGSGGVGKTTISASLAVKAAQQGLKVLVLTIDPAKRLANALGLDSNNIESASRVPGQTFSGELFAQMVEPEKVFNDFIRKSAPNKKVIDSLTKNILYQQLSTTLSGSQEFTSLELLLTAHQSGSYDLIILDTPPAQHAIEFLKSPEKIYSLFQKNITKWFLRSSNESSLIKRVLHKSTRLAMDTLEKVTGDNFINELSDFFENMGELQKVVSQRSLEVKGLLADSKTGFILVTALDEAKLQEAADFYMDLSATGAQLSYVVVNKAFQVWAEEITDELLDESQMKTVLKLNSFAEKVNSYYNQKDKFVLELSKKLGSHLPVIRIPEAQSEVVGLKELSDLANTIKSEELGAE